MPNFGSVSMQFLKIGRKLPTLYYNPVIWTPEKKAQWEGYSIENIYLNAAGGQPLSEFNRSLVDYYSPYIYHVDRVEVAYAGP